MFSWKRSFLALLAFLLLYVLVLVGIDALLRLNKPKIEAFIASQLPGFNVSVGKLYNLPFVFVGAKNVSLTRGEGNEFSFDSISIFYLPSFFWEREKAIYRIEIRGGNLQGEITELRDLLVSSNTYALSPKIVLRNTTANFSLFRMLFVETSISNMIFSPKIVGWNLSFMGNVSVRDNYNIHYLDSEGSFFINSYGPNWWEKLISSKLQLSLGGIPIDIFTNLNGDLSLYRKTPLVKTNSRESFSLHFQEHEISYQTRFSLRYQPREEKGFLEYYFSPGTYTLTSVWKRSKLFFSFSMQGDNNQMFDVVIHPDGGKVVLVGEKGGTLSFDWKTNNETLQAYGFMKDFLVVPDLIKLGGKIDFVWKNTKGSLSLQNLLVNRGWAGNTRLQIHSTNNGLYFSSESGNLFFKGSMDRNIIVSFEGSGISGAALTAILSQNVFNLSETKLTTRGTFILNSRGLITINGKATGSYYSSRESKMGVDYLIRTESPTNAIILLSNFSFPQANLRGDFTIKNVFPNRRFFSISITGIATHPLISKIPLSVSYEQDLALGNGQGKANLSSNILVLFNHTTKDYTLQWSITNQRIHLPIFSKDAFVFSEGTLQLKNNRLYRIVASGNGQIEDATYKLRIRGQQSNAIFILDTFWLALGQDTLIGEGRIYETPTPTFEVGFIRGGGIAFQWNANSWQTIFDLRKVGIMLPGKKGVIFDGAGKIKGKGLEITGEGQCSVSDGENTFRIRSITKDENRLTLNGVEFSNKGIRLEGSGFWQNTPHSAGWDVRVMVGEGSLIFLSMVGGYEKGSDGGMITYRIPEWKVLQKSQPPWSGRVRIYKDELIFEKNQLYGINGRYTLANHALTLEYLFPRITGNINGYLSSKEYQTKSQHRLNLSLLDKWQGIRTSGSVFAVVNLSGPFSDPQLDGSISLHDFSLSVPGILTRITNQYIRCTLENESLVLPRQKLTTTTGNFWIQGAYNIFKGEPFSFRLGAQRSSDVIRLRNRLVSGNIYPEIINIAGNTEQITLSGNLHFRQLTLWLSLQSLLQNSTQIPSLPVFLGLNLFFDQKVSFQSEIVNLTVEPGAVIKVEGPLSYLTLSGKLNVASGNLWYLSQNYQITEGTVVFQNELLPSVDLQAKYKYRDSLENIDIYLTFKGKLPTINLVNFYSIPERKKEELIAYLGLPQATQNTNVSPQTAQQLVTTGLGLAQDVLVIAPISARLRQQLGLDFFTIRSTLTENYSRYLFGNISNLSWAALLSGSSVGVGRYILPNVLVEADVSFHGKNVSNTVNLVPVYSLGVSYSLGGLEMGWVYSPIIGENIGETLKYEQKLEINYKRRF